MKTYVIDNNFLRRERSKLEDLAGEGYRFVIPGCLLTEICTKKDHSFNPRWEDTLRKSLRSIAPFKELVSVSIEVHEGMQIESDTRRAIKTPQLIHEERTSFARNLLHEIESDDFGNSFRWLSDNVENRINELNLSKNYTAQKINSLVKKIEADMDSQFKKELKTIDEKNLLKEISALVHEVFPGFFKMHGFSAPEKQLFLGQKAMTVRYWYVTLITAYRWIQKGYGGITTYNNINRQLDYQYVILSSYFDGVLSNEIEDVLRMHDQLKWLIE